MAYAAMAAVLLAFVFFYPVWTAAPLSIADHEMRVWVDTW
jgi:dolichyl-phosphate-mannose--protein O-mannosyl transferase